MHVKNFFWFFNNSPPRRRFGLPTNHRPKYNPSIRIQNGCIVSTAYVSEIWDQANHSSKFSKLDAFEELVSIRIKMILALPNENDFDDHSLSSSHSIRVIGDCLCLIPLTECVKIVISQFSSCIAAIVFPQGQSFYFVSFRREICTFWWNI